MNAVTAPVVTGGAATRRASEGAAGRLYIEYRERIYRFCYARLRSREEAEDAVQNVFLRVHMALDKGVVPEYEAAWLYKIAHNVCLSRVDSKARRGAEELHAFDEDDVQIAAPDVSSDELAGLSAALEDMPHNLRTAILLREWQGLSYAEIAVAMELSVSAVETLIFRARRHLAWALEHPGEKRKTPVARLLDLLGLGWLRNLFLGGGTVAKLAAGAALVALSGGGAAVALTTASTHAPRTPSVAHLPGAAPVAQVVAVSSTRATASRAAKKSVSRTRGVRHPVRPVVAAATPTTAPTAVSAAASGTVSRPASTSAAAAPAPVATPRVTTTVQTAATTAPSVPTVAVPTVTTPTVSAPTATLPTVDVPTVSVPTVTVPTVSLPIG